MHQYTGETMYIGGPECFYPGGYTLWDAMGKLAEYHGFNVVMPTKNELRLDHEDPRKNADTIFENCADALRQTSVMVADLEFFRGSEPDGGTLYEMGAAYANGARCYGFTRDMRRMACKRQQVEFSGGMLTDGEGRPIPYGELPFCPSLVGAARLIEGDFGDCLKLVMADLDEQRKTGKDYAPPALQGEAPQERARDGRSVVYLATAHRYDADCDDAYARLAETCAELGLRACTPLDGAQGVPACAGDDAYAHAYHQFLRCCRHIQAADIVLVDLNDFHGFEPNGDVSFEAGFAWRLGKKCLGYMADTRKTRARIPNTGPGGDWSDWCGNVVENYDYPINLMFSSAMPIMEGSAEDALKQVADVMKPEGGTACQ